MGGSYMYLRGLTKAFLTSIAVILMVSCSRDRGNKVVIKGSTTLLPIVQKAAEEYRKNTAISISIEGSGSGNGIKALLDGTTQIAMSSREMKDKEIEGTKSRGINAEKITVGYDMIIPVVHPSNKVTNVTMDQLKAVYDGSISNWKILGESDFSIVVLSRDSSSGTYEYWHDHVMKKADVRKDALLQASNGQILSTVAGNIKSIGYIGFGYLNKSVKALKVNGVEGTIDNGKSKKYPISRKLYLYLNKDRISKESRSFVDFILSPRGQHIVREAGYIPL
jgi:phosphate transport system substrate-binding protein